MKKYLDYDGLVELVLKIKELINDIGHFTFKGSVANVAALPALADTTEGWVYAVNSKGRTTSDFVEGAGKPVPAHSEVICTISGDVKKWALLGPIFDIQNCLQYGDELPADDDDTRAFLLTGDGVYSEYSGTLTQSSNPHDLGLYELSGSSYVLTADTTPPSSFYAFNNSAINAYTLSETPSAGDIVFYMDIQTGRLVDSGFTVSSVDDTDPAALVIYTTDPDYTGSGFARLSASDTWQLMKTYYEKEGNKGSIWLYNTTLHKWECVFENEDFVPITNSEIDNLFV